MLKMQLLCCIALCLLHLDYVMPHGQLIYPYTWIDMSFDATKGTYINNNDVLKNPLLFENSGANINQHNKVRCSHLPWQERDKSECYIQENMPNEGTNKPGCVRKERNVSWFTNGVAVGKTYTDFLEEKYWCSAHDPKKCLIPEDMIDAPVEKNTKFGRKVYMYKNPWMAPGRGKVFSPCGCGGGHCNYNEDGSPGRCTCYEGKYLKDYPLQKDEPKRGTSCHHGCEAYCWGDNLEKLYPRLEDKELPKNPSTMVWKKGGTADVVWFVAANHWGGYSYRLCNVAKIGGDRTKLTEECFNGQLGKKFGGPLKFSGDKQWIKSSRKECMDTESNWSKDKWMEVKAKQTDIGTFPQGSQWRKNPFIPKKFPEGYKRKDLCFQETRFGPYSGGAKLIDTEESVPCECTGAGWIYDKVVVPKNLAKGDYVLSFRWDCEKSAQIWSMCSNIRIE